MIKSGEIMNYNLEIPCDVQYIIDVLIENGYEAFMVGGCVRDLILNKTPNDYDITTNAEPQVVASLFDKVILTGLKHGTVTVVINKKQYEVTTYRRDGEYEDSRHPQNVEFVSDIKEDLARRDFTINAMAYNKERGLVDYFDGLQDLKDKKIRTVGNPLDRFKEDALRMLRAIRFSVQLDFEIDAELLNSIKLINSNIENISKERIRDEFNKIIIKNPKGIYLLKRCGLLQYIISELNDVFKESHESCTGTYDLAGHLINSSCSIEDKLYLRLAMLFHHIGKSSDTGEFYNVADNCSNYSLDSSKICEKILRELKYDNSTINKVKTLILYNGSIKADKVSIKKMLNIIGFDLFDDLIKVMYAHIYSEDKKDTAHKIKEVDSIKSIFEEIKLNKECVFIKDLKINGDDLIDIGVKKGRDVGLMLNYLLEMVIKNNNLNHKKELAEIVCNRLNME